MPESYNGSMLGSCPRGDVRIALPALLYLYNFNNSII